LHSLGIAIGRAAHKVQTTLFQGREESEQLAVRVLPHVILTGYYRVGSRIHQSNDTDGSVKESAVEYHVFDPIKGVFIGRRCATKPMVDNPAQPLLITLALF
jgi:hypothetical protein